MVISRTLTHWILRVFTLNKTRNERLNRTSGNKLGEEYMIEYCFHV